MQRESRGLLAKTALGVVAVAILPVTLIWLGIKVLNSLSGTREEASSLPQDTFAGEEGVSSPAVPDEATRTLASGGGALEQDYGVSAEMGSPAAPPPAAWVMIKSGPRAGQSIPLNAGSTFIGRAPGNDLVVDDATVSRQHARISFEEGEYVLEDVGSTGGTMVEGSKAGRTRLTSGTSIAIGKTEMVFMQSEPGIGSAPDAAAGQAAVTMMMEPPAMVQAWLAVTAGPDKGKTYQLKAGDTTIGRDRENDVVFADTAVSRGHALIKHQDGKFLLIDRGSAGGTKVNGQTVAGKALPKGGVVSLGQTKLILVDTEPQDTPNQSTPEGATMMEQLAPSRGVMVVQSGPDVGKSFPLVQGDNTIGRDPSCQIVLTDPAVSRQHALVRGQTEGTVVYDLGSSSGTKVGRGAVVGITLSPGDVISMGKTDVVLMQPPQAAR